MHSEVYIFKKNPPIDVKPDVELDMYLIQYTPLVITEALGHRVDFTAFVYSMLNLAFSMAQLNQF